MYSSNAGSAPVGAAKLTLFAATRYSGVGFTVQPLAHPAGQFGSRRHVFVPVSKALTGAMSALGEPSFKNRSRKGRRMFCRKYRAVSLLNFTGPNVLPSPISPP